MKLRDPVLCILIISAMAVVFFFLFPHPEASAQVRKGESASQSWLLNSSAANVMGRVITHSEVMKVIPIIKKEYPAANGSDLFWIARMLLGRKALLAETAKLYAQDITDEEIIANCAQRFGKEKKEIKDNLDYFKDEYLIDLYKSGRMGLTNRLKGVSPDFAEYIHVTPKEIRSAFHRLITTQPLEKNIRLAQFLFPRASFSNEDGLYETVEKCEENLIGAPKNPDELKALSENLTGCIYRILEGKEDKWLPEIREFIRKGNPGEAGRPIVLEKAILVIYMIERVEEPLPEFEECQYQLSTQLKNNKIRLTEDMILWELIGKADFTPADLYIPDMPENSGGSKIPLEREP